MQNEINETTEIERTFLQDFGGNDEVILKGEEEEEEEEMSGWSWVPSTLQTSNSFENAYLTNGETSIDVHRQDTNLMNSFIDSSPSLLLPNYSNLNSISDLSVVNFETLQPISIYTQNQNLLSTQFRDMYTINPTTNNNAIINTSSNSSQIKSEITWTSIGNDSHKKLTQLTKTRKVDKISKKEKKRNKKKGYIPALREDEMDMFGFSPLNDPLVLVKCLHCQKTIKASRFSFHLKNCTRTRDLEEFVPEEGSLHKIKKKQELSTDIQFPNIPNIVDYIEGTSCPIKEKKHRSTSKSKKEKDERKKDKDKDKEKGKDKEKEKDKEKLSKSSENKVDRVPSLKEQCLKHLPPDAKETLKKRKLLDKKEKKSKSEKSSKKRKLKDSKSDGTNPNPTTISNSISSMETISSPSLLSPSFKIEPGSFLSEGTSPQGLNSQNSSIPIVVSNLPIIPTTPTPKSSKSKSKRSKKETSSLIHRTNSSPALISGSNSTNTKNNAASNLSPTNFISNNLSSSTTTPLIIQYLPQQQPYLQSGQPPFGNTFNSIHTQSFPIHPQVQPQSFLSQHLPYQNGTLSKKVFPSSQIQNLYNNLGLSNLITQTPPFPFIATINATTSQTSQTINQIIASYLNPPLGAQPQTSVATIPHPLASVQLQQNLATLITPQQPNGQIRTNPPPPPPPSAFLSQATTSSSEDINKSKLGLSQKAPPRVPTIFPSSTQPTPIPTQSIATSSSTIQQTPSQHFFSVGSNSKNPTISTNTPNQFNV